MLTMNEFCKYVNYTSIKLSKKKKSSHFSQHKSQSFYQALYGLWSQPAWLHSPSHPVPLSLTPSPRTILLDFPWTQQTCSHLTTFALAIPSTWSIFPLNICRAPSLNILIFAQMSLFQCKATTPSEITAPVQGFANPLSLLLIFKAFITFSYTIYLFIMFYCLLLSWPHHTCFPEIKIHVGLIPWCTLWAENNTWHKRVQQIFVKWKN